MGILSMTLGLLIGLAGCDDSPQEVEGTVNVNGTVGANPAKIADPVVTATSISGGVRLSWPRVADAQSYTIYRKAAGGNDIPLPSNPTAPNSTTDLYVYNDLVSDTNLLTATTAYTYTVEATPSSYALNIGKWTGTGTTGTIPAKGSKFAAPTAVTLALDAENHQFNVTITPAASGNVPSRYSVEIYRSGYSYSVGSASIIAPATTASIDWSSQDEGAYTARVYGINPSGSYYQNSDTKISDPQTYEALFSGNWYSSPYSSNNTSGSTITAYAYLDADDIPGKAGVSYSFERAPVDAAGNIGDWAGITVYPNSTTTAGEVAISAAAPLVADVLGNSPINSYLYDRGVSLGRYKYRIKAVKGSQTEYREASSTTTISISSYYIQGTISVAAGTAVTNGKQFTVTPTLTYKGALPEGAKLVFYGVKGGSSSYNTGPYVKIGEFSKAELEAASIQPKNLAITSTSTGTSYFMHARIEYADGTTPTNISDYSNYYWNTSSAGVYNYGTNSRSQFYVQLN